MYLIKRLHFSSLFFWEVWPMTHKQKYCVGFPEWLLTWSASTNKYVTFHLPHFLPTTTWNVALKQELQKKKQTKKNNNKNSTRLKWSLLQKLDMRKARQNNNRSQGPRQPPRAALSTHSGLLPPDFFVCKNKYNRVSVTVILCFCFDLQLNTISN